MIILNQNNGNKIYGNKYIYNLYSNTDTVIKNLNIKNNFKTNITFGIVGKKDKYVMNPIYDEDETNVNININLLKGDNYIYIYTIGNFFEINFINSDLELKNVNINEYDTPYIINTSYYYDFLLKKGKYLFIAYINDQAKDNFYEIESNNIKLNEYDKYDNFLNFMGNINIEKDGLYNLAVNMKYLKKVLKLIIISDENNSITNKTNYYNKDDMYKMNPIIAYNNMKNKGYYIEVMFKKYNNYTRVSFDNNNKIVLRIVDDIMYLNNKKMFSYKQNDNVKLVFNCYNDKTIIYYFNKTPHKRYWEKLLTIDGCYSFYQKLYETKYIDSHINNKIVIFRKAFIFNCDRINNYIENINFKYYDNKPDIFLNNYTMVLGGSINKNNLLKDEKYTFDIINYNDPISSDTIDFIGKRVVVNECFQPNVTTSNVTSSNVTSSNVTTSIENKNIDKSISKNTDKSIDKSNYNIMDKNIDKNIDKPIDISINDNIFGNRAMFDFGSKTYMDTIKSFTVITFLFFMYIKIFDRNKN